MGSEGVALEGKINQSCKYPKRRKKLSGDFGGAIANLLMLSPTSVLTRVM